MRGWIAAVVAVAVLLAAGCARTANDADDNYVRKADQQTTLNQEALEKKDKEVAPMESFSVSSPAFEQGGRIPARYTCDSDDVSPELRISSIPEGTKTLALIVDDPDAPMGTWVHWLVWNIPPAEVIAENTAPGTLGRNDFGKLEWGGPCPPSGEHRYFFRLYALDAELDLPEGSARQELERAMQGHILARAELMGRYSRR